MRDRLGDSQTRPSSLVFMSSTHFQTTRVLTTQSSDTHDNTEFTFLPVTAASFPLSLNIEPVVAFLAKWGVEPNLLVTKFRYAEPLDVTDPQRLGRFIDALLNSQAFLNSTAAQVLTEDKQWVKVVGVEPQTTIAFSRVPTTLTTIECFDELYSHGVISTEVDYESKIVNDACKFTILSNPAGTVRVSHHWVVPLLSSDSKTVITQAHIDKANAQLSEKERKKRLQDISTVEYQRLPSHGQIVQRPEDIINGVTITDRLREMLFDPESELAEVLPQSLRAELLLQLFELLVLGSGLCQNEDTLLPYIEVAKRLYKDLVAVRRNPSSGTIETATTTIRVHDATLRAVEPVVVSRKSEAKSEGSGEAEPEKSGLSTKSNWNLRRSKTSFRGATFKLEQEDITATNQTISKPTQQEGPASASETSSLAPGSEKSAEVENKSPRNESTVYEQSPETTVSADSKQAEPVPPQTSPQVHTVKLFPSFSSKFHRMFIAITPTKKLVTVMYFAHTPAM